VTVFPIMSINDWSAWKNSYGDDGHELSSEPEGYSNTKQCFVFLL